LPAGLALTTGPAPQEALPGKAQPRPVLAGAEAPDIARNNNAALQGGEKNSCLQRFRPPSAQVLKAGRWRVFWLPLKGLQLRDSAGLTPVFPR
jgi:hypothetical protein